jgi:hypothetical protein
MHCLQFNNYDPDSIKKLPERRMQSLARSNTAIPETTHTTTLIIGTTFILFYWSYFMAQIVYLASSAFQKYLFMHLQSGWSMIVLICSILSIAPALFIFIFIIHGYKIYCFTSYTRQLLSCSLLLILGGMADVIILMWLVFILLPKFGRILNIKNLFIKLFYLHFPEFSRLFKFDCSTVKDSPPLGRSKTRLSGCNTCPIPPLLEILSHSFIEFSAYFC